MSSSLLKLNNFFSRDNIYNEMIILVNKTTNKNSQIVLFSTGALIRKIRNGIRNEFKIRLYMYIFTHQ